MKIHYSENVLINEFVHKALSTISNELEIKKHILLKPNIVSLENYPTTTHPELLEELIIQLRNLGKRVSVAEGPSFEKGKDFLKKTYIYQVCLRHNVPLYHFKTFKTKTCNFGLKIYQIPFEYDYFISLPVLKAHMLKGVMLSCALKNQFAFISNIHRLKLHMFNRINKAIVDVNVIVRPDFYIIDATEVLLNANEKRYGGLPQDCGTLFCGTDPVSIDCYAFELLRNAGEKQLTNKSVRDIPYITQAEQQGLGSTNYLIESI
jgi:uncharacterized protein (DUF362 family)